MLSVLRGNDIEKRLSKLEGQAGELISRIRNDMDSGKSFTTLKRTVSSRVYQAC